MGLPESGLSHVLICLSFCNPPPNTNRMIFDLFLLLFLLLLNKLLKALSGTAQAEERVAAAKTEGEKMAAVWTEPGKFRLFYPHSSHPGFVVILTLCSQAGLGRHHDTVWKWGGKKTLVPEANHSCGKGPRIWDLRSHMVIIKGGVCLLPRNHISVDPQLDSAPRSIRIHTEFRLSGPSFPVIFMSKRRLESCSSCSKSSTISTDVAAAVSGMKMSRERCPYSLWPSGCSPYSSAPPLFFLSQLCHNAEEMQFRPPASSLPLDWLWAKVPHGYSPHSQLKSNLVYQGKYVRAPKHPTVIGRRLNLVSSSLFIPYS